MLSCRYKGGLETLNWTSICFHQSTVCCDVIKLTIYIVRYYPRSPQIPGYKVSACTYYRPSSFEVKWAWGGYTKYSHTVTSTVIVLIIAPTHFLIWKWCLFGVIITIDIEWGNSYQKSEFGTVEYNYRHGLTIKLQLSSKNCMASSQSPDLSVVLPVFHLKV